MIIIKFVIIIIKESKKNIYIKDFKKNDIIEEIYQCTYRVNTKTKDGRNYIALGLKDRTGSINAKIWNVGNNLDCFKSYITYHTWKKYSSILKQYLRRERTLFTNKYFICSIGV